MDEFLSGIRIGKDMTAVQTFPEIPCFSVIAVSDLDQIPVYGLEIESPVFIEMDIFTCADWTSGICVKIQ